jgi:hypothetical protein
MANRSPIVVVSAVLLALAMTIPWAIIISGAEASYVRNALIVLNWLIWLSFTVTYPIGALQSGSVKGINPISPRSSRSRSPARYWTGLVVFVLLWAFLFCLVTLYSYMAWYVGA